MTTFFSDSTASCWRDRLERMMKRTANMAIIANAVAVKGMLRATLRKCGSITTATSTKPVMTTVRATSHVSSKEPRSCPTA